MTGDNLINPNHSYNHSDGSMQTETNDNDGKNACHNMRADVYASSDHGIESVNSSSLPFRLLPMTMSLSGPGLSAMKEPDITHP